MKAHEATAPLSIVVVKAGGDIVGDADTLKAFAANVAALVEQGHAPVILHGGGPQTNALTERLGLVPRKVAGRRITSPEDLRIVMQAICGEVNVLLTCALLETDVDAFGMHGASGSTIVAQHRPPRRMPGLDEPVDFGEVGDVTHVDGRAVRVLIGEGYVPVIATLGVSSEGRPFNINADTTAAALAVALKAHALLLVTEVGGVYADLDDPTSRLEDLTPVMAASLIQKGVIQGGMIPKVEEALAVIDRGVPNVCIVGVDADDAFLEVLAGGRSGTRLRR